MRGVHKVVSDTCTDCYYFMLLCAAAVTLLYYAYYFFDIETSYGMKN